MTIETLQKLFYLKNKNGVITPTGTGVSVRFSRRGKEYNYKGSFDEIAKKLKLNEKTENQVLKNLEKFVHDNFSKTHNISDIMEDLKELVNKNHKEGCHVIDYKLDNIEYDDGVVDPTLDIIFDTNEKPALYDRVGNIITTINTQTYTSVELLFMDDYLLNG